MSPSASSNNQVSYLAPEDKDEEYCAHASDLASSTVLPMVLQAAIQLELFEIMAKWDDRGFGMSALEISTHLETNNVNASAMLDRMLFLLASHGLTTCSADERGAKKVRVYRLTPVAMYFVRNGSGASYGQLVNLAMNKAVVAGCGKLKDAVIEGGVPFDKAHGVNAFEYAGKEPDFNQTFNSAMQNQTTIFMSKMLESYPGFETVETLVDIGGGLGKALSMITAKYPNIHGINFDLAHVIEQAPPHLAGVEHVKGDMFDSIPKGDAIFLKWILHDWDDEHCLKLLKNCHDALPDCGKVIVVDAMLPEMPDDSPATKFYSHIDMLMLAMNPGGKERRQKEFVALAELAGFSGVKFTGCFCMFSVMEFVK